MSDLFARYEFKEVERAEELQKYFAYVDAKTPIRYLRAFGNFDVGVSVCDLPETFNECFITITDKHDSHFDKITFVFEFEGRELVVVRIVRRLVEVDLCPNDIQDFTQYQQHSH